MITSRLEVDQIEIVGNGVAQIRFLKIITDDDGDEILRYHRTGVQPGGDIAAQIKAVHDHLAQPDMGAYPPLAAADEQWTKGVVHAAHTPEVIAAFQANQVKPGDKPKAQPALTGLMQSKTIIEQTVLRRDGLVIVRPCKLIEDNGNVLARKTLNAVIVEPGATVAKRVADAGCIINQAHLDKAQRLADVVHTPAVVKEFRDRVARRALDQLAGLDGS